MAPVHVFIIFWAHRGAEPTLGFIILKYKDGHDTSAENHCPRCRGILTLEF